MLEIPSAPYVGDSFANNAKVMSGPGESNDSLILNPTALTIADNGAILILQGGATKSIKAFDFDGKPWKFFTNGTSSVLPLVQDAATVTWVDISIEPTNLVYVLSYTGAGTQPSDYRLDVYDANAGTRVVRNTGIAVGRIVVDKFRGLYSLNRETVKGSPIVEPSASVWAPSPPPALAVPLPHVTLARIIRYISGLSGVPHGAKKALLVSLERLRQELSRGSRHGVEKELNAFLHKLAALHGVDSASIAALMNQARILSAAL